MESTQAGENRLQESSESFSMNCQGIRVCQECSRAVTPPSSPTVLQSKSPSFNPSSEPRVASDGSLEHRHPSPTYADVYKFKHARPQAMSLPFQSPTSVAIGPGDFLPESLELSAGVNMPTCMKDEVCLLYAPKSELRPSIKTAGLHKRRHIVVADAPQPTTPNPAIFTAKMAAKTQTALQNLQLLTSPDTGPHRPEAQDQVGSRSKMIVPVALSLLVLQNACQMLSMRYTKLAAAAAAETGAGQAYLSSSAVVVSELLKVSACFLVLATQHGSKVAETVYTDVIVNWKDTLLVSVPAFVYMLQNNLLYIATANLDATTCQITYQLKIFTTALFAVGMLGKQIPLLKWLSLCVLVSGIALVQLPSSTAATSTVGKPVVGLSAIVAACFMSGFAGIYLERVLKNSATSLWTRNIQMGSIGFLLAILTAFATDGKAIMLHGFFQGWNPLVAAVAAQVGLGGLLTALVVRYADNILKGFATSLSIVLSGFLSMYFIPEFDFKPGRQWVCGSCMVILATILYSLPDAPKSHCDGPAVGRSTVTQDSG